MKRKDNVITLLCNCLLYKIRNSVRMITVNWNEDFSWMQLSCYLDTIPEEKDIELMEDAIALFISYGNNYEINFELSVQFSNHSLNEVGNTGKFIIYARYEGGTI